MEQFDFFPVPGVMLSVIFMRLTFACSGGVALHIPGGLSISVGIGPVALILMLGGEERP